MVQHSADTPQYLVTAPALLSGILYGLPEPEVLLHVSGSCPSASLSSAYLIIIGLDNLQPNFTQ